MMKQLTRRGFTLIELLVVIAIIGILASVVLASLNTARDKGEDAAAKSALNNARAQAEIYYDDNGRMYDPADAGGITDVCQDTGSENGVADLVTNAGASVGQTADCDAAADAWAAEVLLNNGNYYCADSTGQAGENAASKGAAATVCP